MMDSLLLAAATFAFTVLGTAVTTTWRVGRMLDQRDNAIIKKITDHELSDTREFSGLRSEFRSIDDSIRHDIGETGAALRQKMHDMEMWGRDNNLSKMSFNIVTGEIKDAIKTISGKLDNVIMRNAGIDQGRV